MPGRVPYGARKVSDGVRNVSHDVRKMSDIIRKVSHGHGVRKVRPLITDPPPTSFTTLSIRKKSLFSAKLPRLLDQ